MSNEDNKKPINPKREKLILLSAQASELREEFINNAVSEKQAEFYAEKPLNYYLLNHIYQTDGATEFNTFKQWKEQGRTIKKGSTAFAIWGQPIRPKVKSETKEEEQDEYKYFPMCYLFSNLQLVEPEAKGYERPSQHAQVEETEPLTLEYI